MFKTNVIRDYEGNEYSYDEFISEIKQKIGLDVELISGAEEARLI